MASGFQNNQDQLTPNYYRVTVDLTGYNSTATQDTSGSVEPFDFNAFSTLNTTAENSKRRARGNIRWNAILNELQKHSNLEILNVTVLKTGPAAQTAADDVAISLAFTIGYAQEEFVVTGVQSEVGTSTLSDGTTTLNGNTFESLSAANRAIEVQKCIREAITKGITIGGSNGYTVRYRTIVPLESTDSTTSFEQRDEYITVEQPDVPAEVWADITVNLIDTMTQVPA
jgi:hypothetical protein